MTKRKIFILIGIIIIAAIVYNAYDNYIRSIMPGGMRVSKGRFAPKHIKSDDITKFYYIREDSFELKAEVADEKVHVVINTGDLSDGMSMETIADYESDDLTILSELQKIIRDHEIYKSNGYEKYVNGLPYGYGEQISVEYKTGEKINISSNDSKIFPEEVSEEFFKVFEKHMKDNYIE